MSKLSACKIISIKLMNILAYFNAFLMACVGSIDKQFRAVFVSSLICHPKQKAWQGRARRAAGREVLGDKARGSNF